MIKNKQTKIKCKNCGQLSGVEIIYSGPDMLGENIHRVGDCADAAFGGSQLRWDWEEELINTRCLQCKHEWHE